MILKKPAFSVFPRWSLITTAFLLIVAFRIVCAFHYRVDSDEPQHLHVVWGISHGLIQYKDIFDNHSPLFQLLCEPLFRALGDSANILVSMRLAMFPLFFGCIGCIYLVCARLFSRFCGLLAALLCAFFPRFFCTSIEFRPDNLWAFVWLLLLLILICVRRPATRWFFAGVLLGMNFSISMKTTVMAIDLVVAGAVTWILCRRIIDKTSAAAILKATAFFLCGVTIIPSLLLLFFAVTKSLPDLYYCIIGHNLVAASERKHFFGIREFAVVASFSAILLWCARIANSGTERSLAIRRVFLLTACGFYPLILFVFWPLVTREDFLAFIPMTAMIVAPLVETVSSSTRSMAPNRSWVPVFLAWGIIMLEVFADVRIVKPWRNRAEYFEKFIANVLRMTDPGDSVMDAKGETIFRNRPYYYVFEEMTRWKFQRGELQDDIPELMISRGICVAAKKGLRYPERTAHFLKTDFISVADHLVVAGKFLYPEADRSLSFDLAIPAKYTLVWKGAPVTAFLDNKLYAGNAVQLAAGRHTLLVQQSAPPVAIIWAKAAERGFTPFFELTKEEISENAQAKKDNIL